MLVWLATSRLGRAGRGLLMLVGLTGGIGSGKSTVAGMFAEAGLVVIDADAIAREVVEPGTTALAEIADRFGDDVVVDGHLDRGALAAIVFDDDAARADLEDITHPAIRAEVDRRHRAATAADPDAVVVLDHPLLVETGQAHDLEAVVVVLASRGTRRRRLVEDRGMDPDDVGARMAVQADDDQRRAVATRTIDNDGSLDDLAVQVAEVVDDLLAQSARSAPESPHG